MSNTNLPYEFDLLLDCKTQEQLQRKYEYAKGILANIHSLLESYPCIHVADEPEPEPECACGNPEFGFPCVCDWVEKHEGTTNYSCQYCGIYTAGAARCSECEAD